MPIYTGNSTTNAVISSTSIRIPVSNTSNRPSGQLAGALIYNTSNEALEMYEGSSWAVVKSAFTATGGNVTDSGGYRIHTFTSSGTFQITKGTAEIEYLVVGGGGAGGFHHGGGGGAGGYRCSVLNELSGRNSSAEARLNLGPGSYTVVVGAGGAQMTPRSTPNTPAYSGSNSSFHTIVSLGGGGGGQTESSGASGGSGGGAWNWSSSYAGGSGTAGQGFDGGDNNTSDQGGGGGGAGGAGDSAPNRNGGSGIYSSITGSSVARGGGGGAAGYQVTPGTGGVGGGGNGGSGPHGGGYDGSPGGVNTGGGGGGTGAYDRWGGAGGSGIVIVRYRA